ncbi:MAG: hypothetical protein WDO68_28035 [Gammaproteobacteria bacterium]
MFRLFSKLDSYLCEIESTQWKRRYPQATLETTNVIVKLHPESDPVIAKLLTANSGWVATRGAQLILEELELE